MLNYKNFLLDSVIENAINESIVYFSPDFRNKIKSITFTN